jgi:hypothetical protein
MYQRAGQSLTALRTAAEGLVLEAEVRGGGRSLKTLDARMTP